MSELPKNTTCPRILNLTLENDTDHARRGIGEHKCYYCGEGEEKDEMRPYGPNGSWIHFDCMMEDPKREAAAKEQFGKQLDAAGTVAVIDGDPTGVRPYKPSRQ